MNFGGIGSFDPSSLDFRAWDEVGGNGSLDPSSLDFQREWNEVGSSGSFDPSSLDNREWNEVSEAPFDFESLLDMKDLNEFWEQIGEETPASTQTQMQAETVQKVFQAQQIEKNNESLDSTPNKLLKINTSKNSTGIKASDRLVSANQELEEEKKITGEIEKSTKLSWKKMKVLRLRPIEERFKPTRKIRKTYDITLSRQIKVQALTNKIKNDLSRVGNIEDLKIPLIIKLKRSKKST